MWRLPGSHGLSPESHTQAFSRLRLYFPPFTLACLGPVFQDGYLAIGPDEPEAESRLLDAAGAQEVLGPFDEQLVLRVQAPAQNVAGQPSLPVPPGQAQRGRVDPWGQGRPPGPTGETGAGMGVGSSFHPS